MDEWSPVGIAEEERLRLLELARRIDPLTWRGKSPEDLETTLKTKSGELIFGLHRETDTKYSCSGGDNFIFTPESVIMRAYRTIFISLGALDYYIRDNLKTRKEFELYDSIVNNIRNARTDKFRKNVFDLHNELIEEAKVKK
jgi:hypothetical protein